MGVPCLPRKLKPAPSATVVSAADFTCNTTLLAAYSAPVVSDPTYRFHVPPVLSYPSAKSVWPLDNTVVCACVCTLQSRRRPVRKKNMLRAFIRFRSISRIQDSEDLGSLHHFRPYSGGLAIFSPLSYRFLRVAALSGAT